MADSVGQSPEDFAQTLRETAERTLAEWKAHHIGCDEAHRPKADKVEKNKER